MPFQEPLMKKRMTIMVIALLVVFGGIIAFNLIKGLMIKRYFAHFELPSIAVSSVMAKEQNWEPWIGAVGNFVAINGVDVNSQSSGKVVAIHFNSGQFLQKDQPLIDIDDSVEQATLSYNQADLVLQDINYKRQIDLSKRGATSASSVDEAKAKMLQAQANVDKTQALIRQKHITTPFAGQLGIRKINLGDITPGQTAIVALQLMDPLYLEFYVPEQLLGHLSLNQTITFSVEQNPGLRFQGKITAINSKIDTNTHTIQVEATLPNCPAEALKDPAHSSLVKLKKQPNNAAPIVSCDSTLNASNNIVQYSFMPGMFAAIDIEQPPIPHVVVLPSTAISYTLYGNSVFIIEKDKNPDDKGNEILRVKRVFVSTGEQHGNDTMITKGIKAGQLVAASGELKLQDGTRVTINNDVQLNHIKDPGQ